MLFVSSKTKINFQTNPFSIYLLTFEQKYINKMSKSSFEKLKNSDKPILIDFKADWCGPCKAFAPVLKEVKKELGDKIRIIKIDVDKNTNLLKQVKIMGVPTIMIFCKGKEYFNAPGVQSKTWIIDKLNSILSETQSDAA